jgi:hypothetical protein
MNGEAFPYVRYTVSGDAKGRKGSRAGRATSCQATTGGSSASDSAPSAVAKYARAWKGAYKDPYRRADQGRQPAQPRQC